MVLARPVANANGVTLAGAGTTLNEQRIKRFEAADIDELWIESDSSVGREFAEQQKERLDKRFARAGDSEVWQLLHDVLLERIEQRVK